jgi:hypothetical protein
MLEVLPQSTLLFIIFFHHLKAMSLFCTDRSIIGKIKPEQTGLIFNKG